MVEKFSRFFFFFSIFENLKILRRIFCQKKKKSKFEWFIPNFFSSKDNDFKTYVKIISFMTIYQFILWAEVRQNFRQPKKSKKKPKFHTLLFF